MNVNDIVAAKIAAAQARAEAAKRRRAALAAARQRGLAHRHAAKLNRLATESNSAAPARESDSPANDTTTKENLMNLSQNCDLEINGQYCNRPATVLGLSTSVPELWDGGSASVASFCSAEHAEQEPRPTREQAEAGWADVADASGGQQYIPADAADAWQRLLAAYPAPVPFHA